MHFKAVEKPVMESSKKSFKKKKIMKNRRKLVMSKTWQAVYDFNAGLRSAVLFASSVYCSRHHVMFVYHTSLELEKRTVCFASSCDIA